MKVGDFRFNDEKGRICHSLPEDWINRDCRCLIFPFWQQASYSVQENTALWIKQYSTPKGSPVRATRLFDAMIAEACRQAASK